MSFWDLFTPKMQVYHGPRTYAQQKLGVKGDSRITFQRRELPDAGAMQYSYETFGLPLYSPIGPTVRVRKPNDRYQPAAYVFQAVSLVGMPPITSGIGTALQGQSAVQPLMDPDTARQLGLGSPQAQNNAINNGALAITG